MSAAVLAGRRTRADFLTNYIRKVSPGLMQAIDVVFLHIGAAVFAAVAYASWPEMINLQAPALGSGFLVL